MDDVTWFIVQLVAGGLLWLCVVGGIASHHLLRLAPILRYTITHAANIILTSILASACGLGLIGWLSAMGWPSAQYTVGDSCDRSAGGLALRWNLGAHGGCIHAYALLTPLIVLPITLDAAFTLAHTLEYSWRAHAGDVAEERFAATLAIAMPRMLAAATAAAAAPLTAAFTSHLGNGAYAAPAPVLQLAAAVGLSVLCAHALVLTLVWGGMLLELRGEVRILLQRTIDAPDVAISKTVHATLRRESGIQLFTAIIGAILVALSLLGHSHMPASSGSDPRSDLPRYGSSHAYHQSLHHHALAEGTRGPMPPPRSMPAELTSVNGQPIHMADPATCNALMRSEAVLRSSPIVLSLSSWLTAFSEAEGSTDCAHLSSRARDGGLEKLALRRPDLAEGLLLGIPDGKSAKTGETVVLAMRWFVTLRLPRDTNHAIELVSELQEALREAAGDELVESDGGVSDGVGGLALGGDGIAALELARRAPSSCLHWAVYSTLGASCFLLFHCDPLGAFLILLTLSLLAVLQLGLVSLLPAPLGIGALSWILLATSAATHAPTLALQTLVTRMRGGEEVDESLKGVSGEIACLTHITPPLWRSASTSILALAPIVLLAPMGFLQSLGGLLLVTTALAAAFAIVLVPLLHVALRQPPPPPPPPPPTATPRRRRPTRAGNALSALVDAILQRLPYRFGRPASPLASSPSTYGTMGGSCQGVWQDSGSLPAGGTVSGTGAV